jgi:hypothetical protein
MLQLLVNGLHNVDRGGRREGLPLVVAGRLLEDGKGHKWCAISPDGKAWLLELLFFSFC